MAMDLEKIQSLIDFVAKSGVSEVELDTKEFKINIKTGPSVVERIIETNHNGMIQAVAPSITPTMVAAPPPIAPNLEAPKAAKPEAPAAESKYITVKSPMIGTFYRSPGPDKSVFVNVGDTVKPGQVLCIIEAMKLFNEIESELSGKIIKVLVDDSKPVEYDQPLFLVDPS